MIREEFDKILEKEGVTSQNIRDAMWRFRRSDDLNAKSLRHAARQFTEAYPSLGKGDK